MQIRPNGSRILATLLMALLLWSWLSGRLRLDGLPAPFDISRMEDAAQLAVLAMLCITLVAIVKLLAPPG